MFVQFRDCLDVCIRVCLTRARAFMVPIHALLIGLCGLIDINSMQRTWDGHGKIGIDPRTVNLLRIHSVMVSTEPGFDALSKFIYVNHVDHKLTIRNLTICTNNMTLLPNARKSLMRDSSVARMALLAQRKL